MKSNQQTPIDSQTVLPLRSHVEPVGNSVVYKQKTFSDAIRLSIQVSGFEEKQVYITLGIDAGHWTRMMTGKAHFPQDKLNAMMDFTGNEIPLIWLANSRGYNLQKQQSIVEQERDEAQARADKAEHELEVIKRFLKDTK